MDFGSLGDAFGVMVSVPVWGLVAIELVGVVISMIAFVLAEIISYKRVMARVKAGGKPVKAVVKPELAPATSTVVPAKTERVLQTATVGKTNLPVKQFFWYYVGNSRFATLREALVVTGYTIPENWKPDWSKVPAEAKSRIKRAKLDEATRANNDELVTDAPRPAKVRLPVASAQEPSQPFERRISSSSGDTVMTVTKRKP